MSVDLGVLFILGIGVLGGILGASIFQRFRIPQVVGYIAIGLIIGQSGLRVVTADDINTLRWFNLFALGLIGFLVGGELLFEDFRKYSKQYLAIILGEGLSAFLLVGALVCLLVWLFTHDFRLSLAAGIVLGAISSATDPASTIDVLWEYRSRGVLTTALVAIVALDDVLAMTLYGTGTSAAEILAGGSAVFREILWKVTRELLGAVVMGVLLGAILNVVFRWMHDREKALGVALGAILISIAVAVATEMDIILGTMTLGLTLRNLAPRRSRELFSLARSFSNPIYVIFFVLVGASLSLSNMSLWLWVITAAYVVGRTLGKIGGAWFGSLVTGAPAAIRRYGGWGLFAQGGVAVGLSIMASHHLGSITVTPYMTLGEMVVYVVTATTLIVQIAGPPMVKLAVKRAGEIGRNVTEDDILAQLSIRDMMEKETTMIGEGESLNQVIRIFPKHEVTAFPVVDAEKRMVGIITLERVKNVLTNRDMWSWLLASDVMIPIKERVYVTTPLKEALHYMEQLGFDQLPVVQGPGDDRAAGILDYHKIKAHVSEEVFRRQTEIADTEAGATA